MLKLFTSKTNPDHVLLPTFQCTTHLVRCKPQLPSYFTMQTIHLHNLNNFLNAKCGNNDDIKHIS